MQEKTLSRLAIIQMGKYLVCDSVSQTHCKDKSEQESDARKLPGVEYYPYLARPHLNSGIFQLEN